MSKSSLQAHLFGGLSAINKGAGVAISKIPGIGKSQIDKTLLENSERIEAYKDRRIQTTMHQLLEKQSHCVRPFIDNINTVNRLYNEPVTLIFNRKTLYLGSTPDQTKWRFPRFSQSPDFPEHYLKKREASTGSRAHNKKGSPFGEPFLFAKSANLILRLRCLL